MEICNKNSSCTPPRWNLGSATALAPSPSPGTRMWRHPRVLNVPHFMQHLFDGMPRLTIHAHHRSTSSWKSHQPAPIIGASPLKSRLWRNYNCEYPHRPDPLRAAARCDAEQAHRNFSTVISIRGLLRLLCTPRVQLQLRKRLQKSVRTPLG